MDHDERLRKSRVYYVDSPQKCGVVMFASCTKPTVDRRKGGRSVGSAIVLRNSSVLSEHYIEGRAICCNEPFKKHQISDSEATHIREVSWSSAECCLNDLTHPKSMVAECLYRVASECSAHRKAQSKQSIGVASVGALVGYTYLMSTRTPHPQ